MPRSRAPARRHTIVSSFLGRTQTQSEAIRARAHTICECVTARTTDTFSVNFTPHMHTHEHKKG